MLLKTTFELQHEGEIALDFDGVVARLYFTWFMSSDDEGKCVQLKCSETQKTSNTVAHQNF